MKVTQETLPASQVSLSIEVDSEQTQQVYEQVLKSFARDVRLPGFRQGKVPRHVLLQRVGNERVRAAALEELVQKSVQTAVKQEAISAIGNFQLQSDFDVLLKDFQPGRALCFVASVDITPIAKLEGYKGLALKAEEVTYDATRVDTVLAEYQRQSATLVPVENRPAQKGDVAIVDFVGTWPASEAGGEPEEIPGGKATDFQLDLEDDRFIAGFIDGIVGMQPGDTKVIQATFPEDYPQELMAGKEATFTVTLKELKDRDLPVLDDAFAQEISEFQTLAELRDSLEQRFRDEAESKTRANKQASFMTALAELLQVDLPETLIQQESNAIINETAASFADQGVNVRSLFTEELIQQLRAGSRNEAVTRLKRTIALGELAKLEGISLEESAVELKAKQLLTQASNPQNIDPVKLRQVVAEDLLQAKLMEWFEQNLTVELVPEGSLNAEIPAETTIEAIAETVPETVSESPVSPSEAAELEVADTPAKGKKRKSSAAGAASQAAEVPAPAEDTTTAAGSTAPAVSGVTSTVTAETAATESKSKRSRKKEA
jgi:trigger factor